MALAGLAVSDVKCHAVTSSDAWCEWHVAERATFLRCFSTFFFFLTLVWPCLGLGLGLGLVAHNLMTYTE